MRWKDGIVTAVIVFGIGIIVGYSILGRVTLGNLVSFVGGLFLGLLGGSDILGFISNWYKERREKRAVFRGLVSEIEVNQNRLNPISANVAKILDSDDEFSEEEVLPNELVFESNIYSASSDKLGLLDKNILDKLIQYYLSIRNIEKEYKNLKLIHGNSYNFLRYLEFKEITETKMQTIKPGWQEIKEFLIHVKEIYDLGEELILSLEEKSVIKPSVLKTEHHNIQKQRFEDYETLKNQISEGKKKIREYIKNKSREGIPLYSKLDSIFDDRYISQNEYGEIVDRSEGDEIFEFVADFATKNKLTKDEYYKEFVEAIIKDKTLYELFETIRKNKADLYEKTNEFERWRK